MRVIIKPGGLIAIIAAIISLSALLMVSKQGVGRKVGSGPVASVAPAAGSVSATASTPAPHDGNLLRRTAWQNYMEEGAVSTLAPLSGSDVPAQPAQRITIEKLAAKSWNLGYINKLSDVTLESEEKLRVRFWAKSSADNPIIVMLQRDAPPFPHAWKQHINLTSAWKKYEYDFTTSQRYRPGESVFAIQFGEATGTIDLAGITLERR